MPGYRQTLLALFCAGSWLLAGACGGTSASSGSDDDGAAGTENGSGSGGADNGSGGTGGNQQPNGSAGEFSVDYPDDTRVVDLSDEDYIAVCEAAVEYVLNDAGPAFCTAYIGGSLIESGATDEQIRSQCALFVPACVAQVAAATNCTPPEAECTATVGEMEACVNALGEAGDEISETMPECADLTSDTTLPDATSLLAMDQIGNCAELEQQCPGIVPLPLDALPLPGAGGAAAGG